MFDYDLSCWLATLCLIRPCFIDVPTRQQEKRMLEIDTGREETVSISLTLQ